MIDTLPLPTTVSTHDGELVLRAAVSGDVAALATLLADDAVSRSRGDSAQRSDAYGDALTALQATENNVQLVAERGGTVIATFQLTVIPGLARGGATRLQIETVRVSSTQRSGGVGSALMRWVVDVAAPATGSTLIQLTSDLARVDAHGFYERLGFTRSHAGFKLTL